MATLSPRTCTLSSIDYLVHPQVLGTVKESVRQDTVLPVTLLTEDDVTNENLDTILKLMVSADDVLTSDFTRILVVKPESVQTYIAALGENDGTRAAVVAVYALDTDAPLAALRPGPYFICGGALHQAWRVYDDTLSAFVFGTLPDTVTETPTSFAQVVGIPVPSRHYHASPSAEKPLSGARISLKDVMDVAGTITTLSSRAFTSLQEPAAAMADFVDGLLHAGAVVVGKSKTMQMTHSWRWTDALCPSNPRGDGYQYPMGSSSGAVVGLAGYEWLDGAIGGDTAGSILTPATWAGVCGLRPTVGCSSSRGVQAMCPSYDTLAPSSRSLASLYDLARGALAVPPDTGTLPTRIICPTDIFPAADPTHKRINEAFIQSLERYLGVKRTEVNVAELWSQTADQGREEGLESFMASAPCLKLARDYYKAYRGFRTAYRAKFDKEPFVECDIRTWWSAGKRVTDEEYADYTARIAYFARWWKRHVMVDERAVVVVPIGTTAPGYRDEIINCPLFEAFSPSIVAAVLGAPHVVAPFTQVPYQSRISQREEYRPMCGSLLGAPGSDLMLIRVVKAAFERAGWRTKVDTGRWTFPLGGRTGLFASTDTMSK